jgi:hypothetical protein
MRTRHALTTAAIAASLLLTACSDSDDAGTKDNAGTTPDDNEGGPVTAAFGEPHTVGDLTLTAEIAEVFAPNDYANFGDDSLHALISVTVTNNGDADTDATDGLGTVCQLNGTQVIPESWLDITDQPPGLIAAGATATWAPAGCPIADAPNGTLDYSVTIDGATLWWTGDLPTE